MGRAILAVVVAYIAMAILVIAVFTGIWFGFGPDRLLQPGSFKGNLPFSIAAPAITVLGAIFGGWLCAKIGRGRKPAMVLAAIVLVLGGTMAFFTLQKPFPADPRDPSMTVKQIMEIGREPTWLAIFNPIGGAVGVLIGGVVLARGRERASPADAPIALPPREAP